MTDTTNTIVQDTVQKIEEVLQIVIPAEENDKEQAKPCYAG